MSFEVKSIGEVCSVGDGAHSKVKRIDAGIPYLTSKNIGQGFLKLDKLDFISEESFEKLFSKDSKATRRPQAGDVLFGIIGSFGNTYLYKESDHFGFSSSIGILRPNPEVLDSEYLYYVVSSKKFRDNHANHNSGSVQGYTNIPTVKGLPIPVPSLKIQKKIAEILKSLDQKITLNDSVNQNLESVAQTIFKSWFVDFEPINAKMNGEQPDGMDAATASLFPEKLVESELGLIPEGWEAKPLGDYLTIKRGGSPRPIKDFIVPDGYPWTKIADATANDNPYIFKTKEFIKEEGLKKTVYLKKGTLILSNSATPGLPRFLELDACIHDGWLHFPEKKHFTDSYLYQLFLHIRKHLVSQGNGSVFTNLKTDILRNQIVLVPPKELVDIYEKHAGKFLETVKAKSIESNKLAQLRDTLLPKLLSGEIELGTSEELVEAI